MEINSPLFAFDVIDLHDKIVFPLKMDFNCNPLDGENWIKRSIILQNSLNFLII